MSARHGVYATQKPTGVATPVSAPSGVPFVIGAAPVNMAADPAAVGKPTLITSWSEFVEKFGYSDNWDSYNLCEFAYSHFKLYGCQPVIFCNVLDISTMKEAVAAASKTVTDHKVVLPSDAIDSAALVVKTGASGGDTLVKGTDYTTAYTDEGLVIALISGSSHYSASTLSVAYDKVTPASVTTNAVATAMENIELCMSTAGIIPDLICAPGFSQDSGIAALMTAKAESLNGLFKAKALIDINCASGGCTSYSGVAAAKAAAGLNSPEQIVCWPMLSLAGKKFHMSTQLAGLMAKVDAGNNCPYESPSNKGFQMDALVLADGTEVLQTKAQADIVVNAGVVTALNFLASGWVCWGNYTAAWPGNTDVKDHFINVSRMFGWVSNSLIQTFWSRLDTPLNRRLVNTILTTCNLWLNGLTGSEYVLGARCVMLEEENPDTDLMSGIIRLHIYMTPPSPAQEIDFFLEYDANYLSQVFA